MTNNVVPPRTLAEVVIDLIEEIETGIDVNNDGLIFGKDFYIVGNKPTTLLPYVPKYLPDIIMTWDVYMYHQQFHYLHNDSQIDKVRDLCYYVDQLNTELETGEDKDGDTFVYGVDFKISTKGDVPETLKIASGNLIVISWERYFDHIFGTIYDIYGPDKDISIARLITEYKAGNDIDGNNMIYGKHFILSDYDPGKYTTLWRFEEENTLVYSWTDERLQILYSLGLPREIIVDYTAQDFADYWYQIENPNMVITLPLFPIDMQYDVSNYILAWTGKAFYIVGKINQPLVSGTWIDYQSGEEVTWNELSIDSEYHEFTDAIQDLIELDVNVTLSNPWIFSVWKDVRLNIELIDGLYSIIDNKVTLTNDVIEEIELGDSTIVFIEDDFRDDNSIPIDGDLKYHILKWNSFQSEWTDCGLLPNIEHYQPDTLPTLVKEIALPLFRQSREYKGHAKFIINMSWNDIKRSYKGV